MSALASFVAWFVPRRLLNTAALAVRQAAPLLTPLLLASFCGCGGRGAAEPPASALDLLRGMIAVYQNADSYRDEGVARFPSADDPGANEVAAFSVQWVKPNRLRLSTQQAELACDGQWLRAHVERSSRAELRAQFLLQKAPAALTSDDVYRDDLLCEYLTGNHTRFPPQIELLLAKNPLQDVFTAEARPELLPEREVGGQRCWGVRVRAPGGDFVFWIGAADRLLRRLECHARDDTPPAAGQNAAAPAAQNAGPPLWTADFARPEINVPIADEAFRLEPPAGARAVASLVRPPLRLPSRRVGEAPGFSLVDLNGGARPAAAFRGQITALLWFANHPRCREALARFEEVRRQFANEPRVAFHAVWVEPGVEARAELAEVARGWKIATPLLRDVSAQGRDAFDITEELPALVVLGPDSELQVFEYDNPEWPQFLPQVLRRLRAGEDVAGELLARQRQDQADFERRLQAALARAAALAGEQNAAARPEPGGAVAGGPRSAEGGAGDALPARDPFFLQRRLAWRCREVAAPGDVLLDETRRPPRLFVLSGGRAAAELNDQGQVTGRHDLGLPEGVIVTHLEQAVGSDGAARRLAYAPLGAQVFVYDADWRLTLRYPPAEQAHEGVVSARLTQGVAGEPLALVIGLAGDLGVQAVALSGQRAWSNRGVPVANSLALAFDSNSAAKPADGGVSDVPTASDAPPAPDGVSSSTDSTSLEPGAPAAAESGPPRPEPLLVTASSDGVLSRLRLASNGRHEPPLTVRGRVIESLFAAAFGDGGATCYCGLARGDNQQWLAVGLNREFREKWAVELPGGDLALPGRRLASGRLTPDGAGYWLLVNARGEFSCVRDDGDFADSWRQGAAVTGFALGSAPGSQRVYVAAGGEVTAWTLETAKTP